MNRKTVRIIAFSLTFLIGVSFAATKFYDFHLEIPQGQVEVVTVESVNKISDEENAKESQKVYSTVIKEKYLPDRAKQLVFSKESIGCRQIYDEKVNEIIEMMEQGAKNSFKKIYSETWENYKEANKKCVEFVKNFEVSIKQNFISKSESEKIFGGNHPFDGWSNFYKKYPESTGEINFSNVGFNAQSTQAIVYVVYGCGGLCGSGEYYLLEKKNGKWEIIETANSWVS